MRGTYTVAALFTSKRMGPRMRAEPRAPIRIAICWARGVAPTRKPVLRSCEVLPPLDEAMQTTAETLRAVSMYAGPVRPTAQKMMQVRSRWAMVMPEIGLDEEPISPVRREET